MDILCSNAKDFARPPHGMSPVWNTSVCDVPGWQEIRSPRIRNQLFHNMCINEVKRHVYSDVFCNDAIVFTIFVLRQKKAFAIGGPCSAQLSKLKCMASELHFYLAPLTPRLATGHTRTVPR